MNTNNPEAFAPGEYIREELEARGWSQLDLADILGRPAQAVNEIVNGKRAITPDTAKSLGQAFGTSAQLWLNLESAYQLAQLGHQDSAVARKARLYEFAPVSDMQKRSWIERSSSIEVLETDIATFFDIKSIDQPVPFQHAARKSTDHSSITPPQLAWLYRARNLARTMQPTGRFSPQSLQACMERLSALKTEPEEARHVPNVLSEAGIRFVVVAPLPNGKIDGVCFWMGNDPVIALSFRFDRIDWFWHTLMHEFGHLVKGEGKDAPVVDMQLVGRDAQPFEEKSASEKAADSFACEFLVPQGELSGFVSRTHPLYARAKILGFAKRVGTHPGMVVGQLQHTKRMPYTHNRAFLVSVRDMVTATALSDGWGHDLGF